MNIDMYIILHVQLTKAFVSKVHIVPGGVALLIHIMVVGIIASYPQLLYFHSLSYNMHIKEDFDLQSSIQPQLLHCCMKCPQILREKTCYEKYTEISL